MLQQPSNAISNEEF